MNNHKSEKDCNTWARHGHCQINAWMLKHCAKACRSCKTTEEKATTTRTPDTDRVTTSKKTGQYFVYFTVSSNLMEEFGV